MANPQVNDEFSRFGIIMIIIAILTLLNFIWTILILFLPIRSPLDLIVSIIITISIAILFILECINIIRAGKKLNDPNLIAFSPKFIVGTIIKVVGDQLFVLAILQLLAPDLPISLISERINGVE